MDLTAVDLSLPSKRIAAPTLDHDLILSNTAAAVGSRAGVASLLVIKNLLGGGGVTVSASAPASPASGNQWWDTSGNPDAGLKIRIGSSWVLVDDVLPSAVSQAQAEAGTVRHNTSLVSAQGCSSHRGACVYRCYRCQQRGHHRRADRLMGAGEQPVKPRADCPRRHWREFGLRRSDKLRARHRGNS